MRIVRFIQFTEFEWDENKRAINLRKSGLDFPDAAAALLAPHLEASSDRGEPRTKAIAQTNGRIIVVIFTMRGPACRIISAWPADGNEQRAYRQIFCGSDP